MSLYKLVDDYSGEDLGIIKTDAEFEDIKKVITFIKTLEDYMVDDLISLLQRQGFEVEEVDSILVYF